MEDNSKYIDLFIEESSEHMLTLNQELHLKISATAETAQSLLQTAKSDCSTNIASAMINIRSSADWVGKHTCSSTKLDGSVLLTQIVLT